MAYRDCLTMILAAPETQQAAAGLPGWVGATVVGTGVVTVLAAGALWMKARAVSADSRAITTRALTQRERFAEFHPRLRPALERLTDDWAACQLWTSLKLGRAPRDGDLGAWPVLLPSDQADPPDDGIWRDLRSGDARIRLQVPDGWSPQDLVKKSADIAAALDVRGVRVAAADGNQLVLEIRAEAPKIDPQTLKKYPERVHTALTRLLDPWDAADLWAELKLGRKPSATDPGGVPTLVPHVDPDNPTRSDSGITRNDVGIRLRLSMPDGWSPHDLEDEKKSQNLASALDVPAVQLIEADGNKALLELRVFDPIAQVATSELVTAVQVKSLSGQTRTEYRLQVPIGSMSCHDDFRLGQSEYGDPMTMNFARDVHRAIQGATRSGKSVTFNTMIAYSLLMKDTITVIIDPNGATVAPFWECADYVCDSEDPEHAIEVFDIVLKAMYARKKMFPAMREASITRFSPELPLWNIFIDENSHYDTLDYKRKLAKVAKQVAKFGGRLNIADQKMNVDSLPGTVKVNLSDVMCHRVQTRQDFDHVLPGLPAFAAMAANSQQPMAQGVAIARLASHERPVRMRVDYLAASACYDIGDAITKARGAKRPPMGSEPDTATTEDTTNTEGYVDLDTDDDVVICLLPECDEPVEQPRTGRPGKYCSPKHKLKHWRQLNPRKKAGDADGDDIEGGEEKAV
ncbi:FtsK/SpoIIIE domain-containing protein (plasmid) [Nocardia sp. NBC_01503]|uniref:FtsK/SpoIIIE domain-containing protein n=1 Tax=Nocardia sp. NBC_01503 TaxID=2975997 RepID=UPI002E7B2AED|nr:FtsK/SpoIIIE domain-containing protein [Nocardia sp. NBC_01503]WTL36723.1 FtsK/SpoIIIE domain-containing protein [Nocardia sp. NBC_01503]